MKWKRGSFLLLMAFLITGCANSEQKTEESLTVGVRADIVNFSNYDKNTGKYYGLEIDIAEELAERLGYSDVEYVAVNAEEREEKLLNQEVDCVIACYSVTEERKKNLDFSMSYYSDCTSALVQKSSLFNSVEELHDATIGVLKGSNVGQTVETWFASQELKQEIHFVEYETFEGMVYALEIGDVDAICSDGCILQQYVTEYRTIYPFEGLKQEYCVATKKGSLLSEMINNEIGEMHEDGTIERLMDKW